jgi:hypothetical protein
MSYIRELATPPSCHYLSLATGETETGITIGNKTWFTCRSENTELGDLIGEKGGIHSPPAASRAQMRLRRCLSRTGFYSPIARPSKCS